MQKDITKLKTVCKTLKQEEIKDQMIQDIISKTNEWIEQAQDDLEFVRPLFNLLNNILFTQN